MYKYNVQRKIIDPQNYFYNNKTKEKENMQYSCIKKSPSTQLQKLALEQLPIIIHVE